MLNVNFFNFIRNNKKMSNKFYIKKILCVYLSV